ncbi:DUF309 domain-containing protein [Alkalihalobacterium chitinilyticum]|uniref:DUF309 domain-containing protein n=1 Tax=Alkalihalobacterium chitinilyticum TaxID=2980103 RepID=A0ABT5V994_9BACI|nr:DUF309 domain-containing protein [Alkalihalobacterium chitinilyticum]MDE5412028.1 DUF309 domain-containing protein [Alkalihalobacterium chitinilyticum]
MKYPQAFIDYLIYFHSQRDFFECHEVLEEHWKSEEGGKEKVWVGFIQIAVALYHYRRQNFEGAKRMITSALRILEEEKNRVSDLGVNSEQLLVDLPLIKNNIANKLPYRDYNIPIEDERLLHACTNQCKKENLQWCIPSDFNDRYLINKHSLRNREDVINERVRQKELKNRKNS